MNTYKPDEVTEVAAKLKIPINDLIQIHKYLLLFFQHDKDEMSFNAYLLKYGGMSTNMRHYYCKRKPVKEIVEIFREADAIQETKITGSVLKSLGGQSLWLKCKAGWVTEEVKMRLRHEKELMQGAKINIKVGFDEL